LESEKEVFLNNNGRSNTFGAKDEAIYMRIYFGTFIGKR